MVVARLATSLLSCAAAASAVTVYSAQLAATTAPAAAYTAASVDQTVLQAPAPPTNQTTSVPIQLTPGGMPGMGNPVSGGFLGFSIELSIADTILGSSAGVLQPNFLNYAALLESRGGSVTIRVGGNTQDAASLVQSNPNGKTIMKQTGTDASLTKTPTVHFTADLLYAMRAIQKLVDVNWFFGIPFLLTDSDGNAGQIVSQTMSALGSNLLGFQLANEPDLYAEDMKKSADYDQQSFFNDTATMIQNLPITEPIILGPSICCRWDPTSVIPLYLQTFSSSIAYIDIIHYPNDNCETGNLTKVPQEVLPNYLSHTQVQGVISPYFPIAQTVLAAGKKIMMLETNTASCGGFQGVSNAFGAALWGIDFGLQMAYGNFSFALFHFGGQNVYYNPFTPPPANMSKTHEWTTGAIFYANLVVAEALGKSGQAQVVDLRIDTDNPNRAEYAIYEQGTASRVLLINYASDPGVADFTTVISIGGGTSGLPSSTPTTVKVKYLLAESVTQQYNITWAGQTLGTAPFTSDGRLSGDVNVQSVNCDPTAQTCTINVPGPSAVIVYLTDAAFQNSGGESGEAADVQLTFPTTTTTGKAGATYDIAALSTSNGRNGQVPVGATSKGGAVSEGFRVVVVQFGVVFGVAAVAVWATLW